MEVKFNANLSSKQSVVFSLFWSDRSFTTGQSTELRFAWNSITCCLQMKKTALMFKTNSKLNIFVRSWPDQSSLVKFRVIIEHFADGRAKKFSDQKFCVLHHITSQLLKMQKKVNNSARIHSNHERLQESWNRLISVIFKCQIVLLVKNYKWYMTLKMFCLFCLSVCLSV